MSSLSKQVEALEEENRQLKRCDGNIILMLRDGFSKPFMLPVSGSCNDVFEYGRCAEPFIEDYRLSCRAASATYERVRFHRTSSRDRFGRVIYLQD